MLDVCLDFACLTTVGLTQNMFAAMGSCASIEYVQEKSSACVELLRSIAHAMSVWVGTRDLNRRHKEVSVRSDIAALCLDLAVQGVHTASKRSITLSPTQTREAKNMNKSAVKDILLEGRKKLVDHGMFDDWMKRTMSGRTLEDEGGDMGNDEVDNDLVFSDPNGQLAVDIALDSNFTECPFSNVDINEVFTLPHAFLVESRGFLRSPGPRTPQGLPGLPGLHRDSWYIVEQLMIIW